MILNIIIKKVLPILTLGIGFSFAIIVGFSNVEISKLEETQSERARENRSRTHQLTESNYCSDACSNRNFVDCKARPCTLDNFTLHCSVALCLH